MDRIFALLIAFQIKHFIADYPLQNEWMLGKFKEKGWALPLLAHSGVHAGFTFLISIIYTHNILLSLGLSVLDTVIHFCMDRIKASPKMLGKFKSMSKDDYEANNLKLELLTSSLKRGNITKDIFAKKKNRIIKDFSKTQRSNKIFWLSLGIDQSVHHLTHYLIIFLMIYLK